MNTLAEYLGQGSIWYSRTGPYPIADMDQVYRRRALRWLARNAGHLYTLWTTEAYVESEHTPDLDTLIGWVDTRPTAWVRETPLFKALMEGVPQELIP